jgi:hypothetical protein
MMSSEWQPIETAPKDGSVILIFRDRKEVKDIYPARWLEDSALVCNFDSEYPWQVLCSERGDNYLPDDDYITHWRNLPDPPKEKPYE